MTTQKADYYETLGVGRDASADDIKRAFRRLAMEFHPDRNSEPGAEARFKEINEAYEVLSDQERRATYDRFGHAGLDGNMGSRGFEGFGPFGGFGDIFDSLMEDLTNSIDGVMTLAGNNFRDQIEFANKRIEEFDSRLEAKRQRLENQFAAMEAALARLQGQSNSLGSLASNVFLAQTGSQ